MCVRRWHKKKKRKNTRAVSSSLLVLFIFLRFSDCLVVIPAGCFVVDWSLHRAVLCEKHENISKRGDDFKFLINSLRQTVELGASLDKSHVAPLIVSNQKRMLRCHKSMCAIASRVKMENSFYELKANIYSKRQRAA